MPNPEYEGIGRQIKIALAGAGGLELDKEVYDTKVKNGETMLTRIHHRQSPMYLMMGKADAGVTWKSEAIFQEKAGNPISHVVTPAEHNKAAGYFAGVMKDAPNPEAAKAWVEFLKSAQALKIFESYGFKPYVEEKKQEHPSK
jgi:sulfate/thiosulfate transport system substrate-binding protein